MTAQPFPLPEDWIDWLIASESRLLICLVVAAALIGGAICDAGRWALSKLIWCTLPFELLRLKMGGKW